MLPAADHQSDLHSSGAGCGAQGRVDGGPEPESERPGHSLVEDTVCDTQAGRDTVCVLLMRRNTHAHTHFRLSAWQVAIISMKKPPVSR